MKLIELPNQILMFEKAQDILIPEYNKNAIAFGNLLCYCQKRRSGSYSMHYSIEDYTYDKNIELAKQLPKDDTSNYLVSLIWIPLQHQLQFLILNSDRMLKYDEDDRVAILLEIFNHFVNEQIDKGEYSHAMYQLCKTMEEMWMRFYMWYVHHKVWSEINSMWIDNEFNYGFSNQSTQIVDKDLITDKHA